MELLDLTEEQKTEEIGDILEAFRKGEVRDGDPVKVKGAIHRIRKMSGFAFVLIRTARIVFQCVWDEKISKVNLDHFSPEECVVIEGILIAEERSRLGFDIRIDTMVRVSGKAAELPIEISNDKKIEALNLNTLLDHRVLTLRNPRVRAIMRIADGVLYSFRDFLRKEGFVEFVPPKIVCEGAEGGADMFEVDYFGRKAYLNQSPQMYKQIMVGVFTKVYTTGPVFRAEKYSTNRHINEFQGLDLEMGFIESFYDLIRLEARMMNHMFQILNEQYAPELELLLGREHRPAGSVAFSIGTAPMQAEDEKEIDAKCRYLPEITKAPTIRFSEAKKLFAKAHPGKQGELALKEPDFSPEEEKWIGEHFLAEYGSPLVFITHYPSVKRPFYAMDDPEDPEVTLSFDCLLNGLEITTGGQRIHDYEEQVKKMHKRNMNIDDFEDYLTMHKYGMPPHGGMGLGMERIVENLLHLPTIKQAAAFPRDRDRLRP